MKENARLMNFIRNEFRQAKCGTIEVQHTPIMTRILIYTTTPGLIIGSGGENIKRVVDILREQYKIENPQIDVKKIDNPDLDAQIVAQSIASSIESGVSYKRLGNYYVSKIMETGAIGCEIIITGKLSGERSRRERFVEGYIKKCGEPSESDVIKGFAVANPKLGNIGITVKIMLVHTDILKGMQNIEPEPKENAEKGDKTEEMEKGAEDR
jgi:small subunit ribosomal protein S3